MATIARLRQLVPLRFGWLAGAVLLAVALAGCTVWDRNAQQWQSVWSDARHLADPGAGPVTEKGREIDGHLQRR
jgi:hypothetical protein